MEEKNPKTFYEKIRKRLTYLEQNPKKISEEEMSVLLSLYKHLCKATSLSEKSGWRVNWKVSKYRSENDLEPYTVVDAGQNIITNTGASEMIKLVCGKSIVPFNEFNARIVVGNSSVAEEATQTGPLGMNTSSAKMSKGFPVTDGSTAYFEAAFGTNQANFEWNEICISNGNVAMNRKVLEDFGTKPKGEIWIVRASVEIVNS